MKKPVNQTLEKLLEEKPEAGLEENKYRTLAYVIDIHYQLRRLGMGTESVKQMIRDIVTLDRHLRKLTEGQQDELKKRLSQAWQLGQGYEPGYFIDIHDSMD